MTNKFKIPLKKISLKPGDAILIVLFFVSMGLTIWGINIYRLTIIDIKFLLVAIVLGIIIAIVALSFWLKSSYSNFWTFFIKATIGGGLFYFGLLFLNRQFVDEKLVTEEFKIIKSGTLGRGKYGSCFQPYVVIDFYHTEKQLVFYCADAEFIKRSTKVTLTYSKGHLVSLS